MTPRRLIWVALALAFVLECYVIVDTVLRVPHMQEKELYYPGQSDRTIILTGIIMGTGYCVFPPLLVAFAVWVVTPTAPKVTPPPQISGEMDSSGDFEEGRK